MPDALLPHDIPCEEAVLGSILLAYSDRPEWVEPVFTILKPEDFYRERNGWILKACIAMKKRGGSIDQVLTASELKETGRLEDIGGPAYLSYLISRVPTPFNAPHYAEMVKDCADRRRVIEQAGKMAADAYEGRAVRKKGFEGFAL